jgi:hypothetical protein
MSMLAGAIDDPAAVRASIQKEMNGYVAAMKKKDTKLVEKFILANFSADFKDTDSRGNVRTREQTLELMKANIAQLKSIDKMDFKITSIKVAGDKATTSEHMVLEATVPGEGAKTSKLSVDSTWTGSYVKKGAKWLCTASKTIKEKVLLDGKPIG